MNEDAAMDILVSSKDRERPQLSTLGEAVDSLYETHGSYTKISKRVQISSERLSSWHRIFQLPKGILWQVDQGKIPVGQALDMAKLEEENDQWMLAQVLVEAKRKLSVKECRNIVQDVLKNSTPIKDAAEKVGVRFDQAKPISLLLPFQFDERLASIKPAWEKHQKIEDYYLQKIRHGVKLDSENVAHQTEKIAEQVQNIAAILREENES
ncbi:MAG: hypothetical protein OXU78_00090 [Deltaproteobacteria bacterium]|nr:hypothetical protein [Deltaproteobacteria bacterium]